MNNQISWVVVNSTKKYFMTEDGNSWTPIGHNDAITWPTLSGLYKKQDTQATEEYFKRLSENCVTCLRLMFDYDDLHLENPVGNFDNDMVEIWDSILNLCGKYEIRLLLTPFDTFWMYRKWDKHPYNKENDGPTERHRMLVDERALEAIKNRFSFFIKKWGGSGIIFAWDLWNEIHPAYGDFTARSIKSYIEKMSPFVRNLEMELYGKAHLQTASIFGPLLTEGYVGSDNLFKTEPIIAEYIYRNPLLDFASIHAYERDTIDDPKNTIEPAISFGRIVAEAIEETRNKLPFLDSEHGPIHAFIDKEKILTEEFDNEYFRHMQWAHFASGGAGGGMRWPNRHPHVLTAGMHDAQCGLAAFSRLVDWNRFNRRNMNKEVSATAGIAVFCCASTNQAITWLLRKDTIDPSTGMLRQCDVPNICTIHIPRIEKGKYEITFFNTKEGVIETVIDYENRDLFGITIKDIKIYTDIAIFIKKYEKFN